MRSLQTRDPVEAAARFPTVNDAINAQFASMRLSHGSWPVDPRDLRNALGQIIDRHLASLTDTEKGMLRFAFNQESLALGDFDERFDPAGLMPSRLLVMFLRTAKNGTEASIATSAISSPQISSRDM
jgi:hypothetical protein